MTNRPARFTQTGIERATDVGIAKYEAVLPIGSRRSMGRQRAQITDQIDAVKVERFPSRKAALAAELEAIRTENPLHNIAGKVAA
jgi:hypothetical protein